MQQQANRYYCLMPSQAEAMNQSVEDWLIDYNREEIVCYQ